MLTCVHLLIFNSVQDGATALYVASQNGHLRVVEVLIAAKAQVDIQQKVRFNCSYHCVSIVFSWSLMKLNGVNGVERSLHNAHA